MYTHAHIGANQLIIILTINDTLLILMYNIIIVYAEECM